MSAKYLEINSLHIASDLDNLVPKILDVASDDEAYWADLQKLRQNGGENDADLKDCRRVHQTEDRAIIVDAEGRWRIPKSDSDTGKGLIQAILSLIHDSFQNPSIQNDWRHAKARVS